MKKLTYSTFSLLLVFFLFAGCGGDEAAPEDDMAMDEDTTQMTAPMGAATGDTLRATLTGDAEVPESGDPDGSGTAEIELNSADGQVCFDIQVENIAEAGAAHIHTGAAGTAGPPVVDFDVAGNGLSGCVDADATTIDAILAAPSEHYVNVHNAEYGGGAVRGQLEDGM